MSILAPAADQDRTSLRVLILDDCPDDAFLCLRELERGGFETSADVVSTLEALEAFVRSKSYDVILSDYNLLGGTGMDALPILNKEGKDIPLILVTGALGEEEAVECVKQGAADYVLKHRLIRLVPIVRRALAEQLRCRNRHLEEQNRLAQAANQAKNRFLANMSHELRSPLNSIIGFAELMYDGKLGPVSDPHKEYLGDILQSAQHLLHLVNEVLDLTKVESGRIEFRLEPVSLEELVREVIQALQAVALKRNIGMEMEVASDIGLVVVDVTRVKQILHNYLSNALKFTPEGGLVAVKARLEPPDHFLLEVEDTGIGIPAEDTGRLFQEFQQLDDSAAKQHEGSGLGLALTKHIVEAQGGRVGVRSTPGEGSTFYALLPCRFRERPTEPDAGRALQEA